MIHWIDLTSPDKVRSEHPCIVTRSFLRPIDEHIRSTGLEDSLSSSHACYISERLPQEPPLVYQQADKEGDSLRVVELDLNADRRYHMFVTSHPKASIYPIPGG